MSARSPVPALVAVLLAAPLLSGCIAAAAIPLGAAGIIGKNRLDHKPMTHIPTPPPAVIVAPTPAPTAAAASVAVADPAGPPVVPPEMQYLYGSGEAAALSAQAYQSLWTFTQARIRDRKAKQPIFSVVMSRGSSLADPRFGDCGKKQLAVVFDVDETTVLNLGFEADDAQRTGPYDQKRWERWEQTGYDKVAAVPGALDFVTSARRDGVAIVYNTNRSADHAGATALMLEQLGLGPVMSGDTLWLRAAGASSAKDERRWAIAEKYCVIALVGDQLGDFSDLFNSPGMPIAIRRNVVTETMVAPLWGAGWFILPNPVYGSGLKGSVDEVFPADKRWSDPAEEKK